VDFYFYCLSFLSKGFLEEWELALLYLTVFFKLILTEMKSEANVCFLWSLVDTSCCNHKCVIKKPNGQRNALRIHTYRKFCYFLAVDAIGY